MGIPICDKCAKRDLGTLYNKINKEYKFVLFANCIICKDRFNDKYCIPELQKDGETAFEAVKRYLKEK